MSDILFVGLDNDKRCNSLIQPMTLCSCTTVALAIHISNANIIDVALSKSIGQRGGMNNYASASHSHSIHAMSLEM